MIPDEVIEEVRQRVQIVQTVQTYVSLKRAGANFKAKCPFHDDSTPSFFVHPDKGIYKCFGCGKGGDAIDFLMSMEGWTFLETVEQLAEEYGIEIPEDSDQQAEQYREKRRKKKRYLHVMDLARNFYQNNLWASEDNPARMYLAERGVDEKTAEAFELGFAPPGWQNLIDYMDKKGISSTACYKSGLALERKSGGHYDRFRNRVMFPISDVRGNVLGFGGRRLETDDNRDPPKYINSPETEFYTKGQQLFGLNVAKKAIRQHDFALVVEGNFDVVTLHASGFDMTVAPLGTALTVDQASLLSRYTDEVLIAFDGDSAGAKAARRCLGPLQSAGLNGRVIRFDDPDDDPDTFVRREGEAVFWSRIEGASSLVEWMLDSVLQRVDENSAEQKLDALKSASEILGQIEDAFLRREYVQEVGRRLGIDDPELVERYVRDAAGNTSDIEKRVVQQTRSRKSVKLPASERGLLLILLEHPEWLDSFFAEELDKLLETREVAEFLDRAYDQYDRTESLDLPTLLEEVENRSFRDVIERVAFERDLGSMPDDHLRWYRECVTTLKFDWAERSIQQLDRRLDQLDWVEDRDEYERVYRQKREIEAFRSDLEGGL